MTMTANSRAKAKGGGGSTQLLKIASIAIAICALAHSQYKLIAWYKGPVQQDATQMSQLPPSLPLSNNRTSHHQQTQTQHMPPPFLRRNESLYKYNISTTPIVIEKYKLLLFAIEKTGSTYLKQLMRRMMGYENYYYHGNGIPHVPPRNGLKCLSDYTLREANEMLTDNEWTRAMFVRDPKERALSGYLMFKPGRDVAPKILKKAKLGILKEAAFEGFGPIRKCCKDRANGDFNYEALCFHHMQTFEGFLGMVEDPSSINVDDDDEDIDFDGQHHNTSKKWSPSNLRKLPSCPNKHWSPITPWRLEKKFWPILNFIGHLETAQMDIKRLLDRLHPDAWEELGASGWGEHRNESMFVSSTTVNHAKQAEDYLFQHYTSEDVERRVENIYADDYENKWMDLARVKIGDARSFYQKRGIERHGGAE